MYPILVLGDAATGMSGAVTAITSAMSVDNLWGQFANVAPFLGIMAVFAFGLYLLRKVVKKGSKGKAGI